MAHLALTIFGWLTALVAVVSLVAGPNQAASIAGTGLSTVGITAGALIGGLDELTKGFSNAKNASDGGPRRGGVDTTADRRS